MAPSAIEFTEQDDKILTLSRVPSVKDKIANGNRFFYNGNRTSTQLVGDALKRRTEGIDHKHCEPGDEDAFFVADMGDVYRQHLRWKMNLKRVKPFYGGFRAQYTFRNDLLTALKPSNAIRILKYFGFCLNLALDLTAHRSRSCSKCSTWV